MSQKLAWPSAASAPPVITTISEGDGREDGIAQHNGDNPQVNCGSPPRLWSDDVHGQKVPHLPRPSLGGETGAMRIEILRGDITTRRVDAIVNAANSSLLGGGGVDGAIHRAAGTELLEACRELRRTQLQDGLPVGDAAATPAFRLPPARLVIHTVGPNRHAGQTDPALLASCFRQSLRVAADLGARSIAFPAISAGIYGWDAGQVAEVAFDAVRSFSSSASVSGAVDSPLELVEFVLFSEETTAVFRAVFNSSPRGGES